MRAKMTSPLILGLALMTGCSYSGSLYGELDERCASEASVQIIDYALWSSYIDEARTSKLQYTDDPQASLTVFSSPNFRLIKLGNRSDFPEDEVYRRQSELYHGGQLVAVLHGFEFYAQTMEANIGANCLLAHPEVFFGRLGPSEPISPTVGPYVEDGE